MNDKKTVIVEEDLESQLLEEEARRGRPKAVVVEEPPAPQFSFKEGKPLPEGFENPQKGEAGHKCLDPQGNYQPTWYQLKLAKVFDHQQNPQFVGCGDQAYGVPLDVWVDVPPGVVNVLLDAVETHHEQVVTPESLLLGRRPTHITRSRSRFMYQTIASA